MKVYSLNGLQDYEGDDYDGVDYIDTGMLGTNPSAKIYPNGKIIGYTDNGKYIKYPDGELECFITSDTLTAWGTLGSLYVLQADLTIPYVSVDDNTFLSSSFREGESLEGWSNSRYLNKPFSDSIIRLNIFSVSNVGSGIGCVYYRGRWKA